MKSKIKKNRQGIHINLKSKKFFMFISVMMTVILLASGISAYATYNYFANEIKYTDTKTVSQALDELYDNKRQTTDETKEITTNGQQTLDKYYKNINVNVTNSTSAIRILTNGQISSDNPCAYLTANFEKTIKTNSVISYKVRIGDNIYGPYKFLYENEGQAVAINAHTTISCYMYNDKIVATYYPGSWYNIYIDMVSIDISNLEV